jgi:two-component system CheB/CheR fusion protein
MMMVAFRDVVRPRGEGKKAEKRRFARSDARASELEKELSHARQELQSTREEMQTSQEEQEMRSMNEELQTVNHELQAKVDELSRVNNDMKNLLNSTDIATLFLDGDMLVRRFTTQTSKLIKLIPADAGRRITDIATKLDYPELADDAREVLKTLIFKEKVVEARGGSGSYTCGHMAKPPSLEKLRELFAEAPDRLGSEAAHVMH